MHFWGNGKCSSPCSWTRSLLGVSGSVPCLLRGLSLAAVRPCTPRLVETFVRAAPYHMRGWSGHRTWWSSPTHCKCGVLYSTVPYGQTRKCVGGNGPAGPEPTCFYVGVVYFMRIAVPNLQNVQANKRSHAQLGVPMKVNMFLQRAMESCLEKLPQFFVFVFASILGA